MTSPLDQNRRAVLGSLLALAASPSLAQTAWPSRPIKMIVVTSPGGGADAMARMMAAPLQQALGQPVIVENRPGGGMVIGTEFALKSPPDGYTILVALSSITLMPFTAKNLRFDVERDIAPVMLGVNLPMVLCANPSTPFQTFASMVAYAKANPGKLNYGSLGTGTVTHLWGESMKQRLGLDIVHVPYKGTGPALTALLGGEIQLLVDGISSELPQIAAGKVVPLAVLNSQRVASAPQIPSIAELGYPDLAGGSWMGFALPHGTPADIVNRLSKELSTIIKDPKINAELVARGMEPVGSTPAGFAGTISGDIDKWRSVIQKGKLQLE